MGVQISPWEGAILRGKGASHCKVYRDTLRSRAKTSESIEMPFELWARMGRRNHGGPEVLRDVAMATNFGTKIAINWLCVNDSD